MGDSRIREFGKRGPVRLVDVLRDMSDKEIKQLARAAGAKIDASKRVDAAVQLARELVAMPLLRDFGALDSASAQLVRRLIEANGVLQVRQLPAAVHQLRKSGLVLFNECDGWHELLLPTAFLVQIPTWEGEDPRGIRSLLSRASTDTLTAIASRYAGRRVVQPVVLAIDEAWEVLSDSASLAAVVNDLPMAEKQLLKSICEEGGEVDTTELMDLEREPMRLQVASGSVPTRRGLGFSLERRGMLMPVRPNLHVVPTEVAALIGAKDAVRREEKRCQIRSFVLGGEHTPRWVRYAVDPAPLAVALSMAVRESGVEVREVAGTPRSLITRLSQRFGRDYKAVALIIALSRAVGLWDQLSFLVSVPPGSWTQPELALGLFRAWQRGGAWDEARAEPELLRLPPDSREASPVRFVRDIVLDALEDLGEDSWVPFEALADYVRNDSRTPGVARLLRRWAARAGVDVPTPSDVAQTIMLEVLPALGVIDVGEADAYEDHRDHMPLVRITGRGRSVLSGVAATGEYGPTAFIDETVLRVGGEVAVGAVLALYPFCEIGMAAESLELDISSSAVSRAISQGIEGYEIREVVSSLAEITPAVAKKLEQLSVVLGRASYVGASGFLWCEDKELREMLRTRRQTADMFLDPSPPGGLLLAPSVTIDVVARRCRALGVEVMVDGEVYRAWSSGPPPIDGSGRAASSRPPMSGQLASGIQRRAWGHGR
ncbi:MAG: hypothetical protein FWD57_07975 [Polyangiaceae bacterium]|nr:hypothetical protein [Polyangiaceae bacterium]